MVYQIFLCAQRGLPKVHVPQLNLLSKQLSALLDSGEMVGISLPTHLGNEGADCLFGFLFSTQFCRHQVEGVTTGHV